MGHILDKLQILISKATGKLSDLMIPALHYVIYKIRNTDMNFCLGIPNVNDEKAIHLRWKRLSLKVSQQNLSLGANYNEKLCTLIVGEFHLKAILLVGVLI